MESTLSQSLSFPTASTPTIMIDPPASRSSSQPPQTIKMEELEKSSSSTGLLDIPGTSTIDISSTLPMMATAVEQKPPPKKRKSWGQPLPEPKTNLPPRKRAKTEDEKEQRRVERIKRNRLAAHQSRERKRQEFETILLRCAQLEEQMKAMEAEMRRDKEELQTYRQMYPEHQVNLTPAVKSILQSNPLEAFQRSAAQTPSLTSPESLKSTVDSFDTPMTSFTEEPATPQQTLFGTTDSDKTQHSAVSVGFGTSVSDAKAATMATGAPLFYPIELSDLHDGDHVSAFNDFPLFQDDHGDVIFGTTSDSSTESYLQDSIPQDQDFGLLDVSQFLDLHAGSGATAAVSDEPGTATEAEHQALFV